MVMMEIILEQPNKVNCVICIFLLSHCDTLKQITKKRINPTPVTRNFFQVKNKNIENNDVENNNMLSFRCINFLLDFSPYFSSFWDNRDQCTAFCFSDVPSWLCLIWFPSSWCSSTLQHRVQNQSLQSQWLLPFLSKYLESTGVFLLLTSGVAIHPVVRVIVPDVRVAPPSLPLPVDHGLGAALGRLAGPEDEGEGEYEKQWQLRRKVIYQSYLVCLKSNLHIVVYDVHWHKTRRRDIVSVK